MSSFDRVLVVDDDVEIAKLLEINLKKFGYEVSLHHRAKGSLEAAREFKPSLILLDVMLGDNIGYQVARSIRCDRLLYKTPILFQSVIAEDRDVNHAYSEGGDGYLTKPYTREFLEKKINHMKALRDDVERRCSSTQFASLALLRREADHLLFRDDPFGLCYLFVDGLPAYHRSRATEAIDHLTQITGRSIRDTIKNAGFFETTPCHLGGGYFMVMVGIDDRKRFVECVQDTFTSKIRAGGPTFEAGNDNGNSRSEKPMRLLIGRTDTTKQHYAHANEMFESLRKIEQVSKQHAHLARKKSGHEHWAE